MQGQGIVFKTRFTALFNGKEVEVDYHLARRNNGTIKVAAKKPGGKAHRYVDLEKLENVPQGVKAVLRRKLGNNGN